MPFQVTHSPIQPPPRLVESYTNQSWFLGVRKVFAFVTASWKPGRTPENLLDDTVGLLGALLSISNGGGDGGGRINPSVTCRCGGLRLSLSADVCSSDDVIAF